MAKPDRLFRLLDALRRLPQPVTADRLAAEMEVSARTLYRDIASLRAAGARIEGEAGLGYVVYGWFACRIEATPQGLKFVKVTGSQRPSGLLFPENDRSMVLLGSMALAQEPPADSYGRNPDRDLIAGLERIGEARWRLVVPWPQNESNLDLIELRPAS